MLKGLDHKLKKIILIFNKVRFYLKKFGFRFFFFSKYYLLSLLNFIDVRFFGETSIPMISALNPIYINLESRIDRRNHIEREILRMGFKKFTRFAAVRRKLGILGCNISHRDIIASAIKSKKEFVFIIEDDAKFVCSRRSLDKTITSFLNNSKADVLCLGNNVLDKPILFEKRLKRTRNTQTTSCYIMKNRVFESYLTTLNHGISLIENGSPERGAIDIVWKDLQDLYAFVIPKNKMVIQMSSYSDITKSQAQYLA